MSVTIEIGTTSIKLLSTSGKQVEKWGTAPLSPGVVRNGQILQPEALAATIDSLFKSLQIPKGGVTTAVSGLTFTYRFLWLPRLKTPLIKDAILRAAKKEIPLPLDQVYITWQIIGGSKDEIEVFLLGVPRNLVDAIVKTFNLAGVKLLAIDLKALALARLANRSNALIVSFEPDCFNVVLVAEGKPAILHTVTPKNDSMSLEDNVNRLIEELGRTVEFYNLTHINKPVEQTTTLLLTGELAGEPSAVNLIKNSIGYPVKVITTSLNHPADFAIHSFAGNIGLALKGMKQETLPGDHVHFADIDINVLDGKRRTETRLVPVKERALPITLIAAIVILLIASIARTSAHEEKARLQKEVDVLARELSLARARTDESARIQTTIKNLAAETAELQNAREKVLGKTVNDADILKSVTISMSPGVSFSSLEISPQQVTIVGQAGNKADIITYAEILGRDARFTEVRIARIGEEADVSGNQSPEFTIVLNR